MGVFQIGNGGLNGRLPASAVLAPGALTGRFRMTPVAEEVLSTIRCNLDVLHLRGVVGRIDQLAVRLILGCCATRTGNAPEDDRITEISAYFALLFADRIDLDQLAANFRAWKRQFGEMPLQYQIARRLTIAEERLFAAQFPGAGANRHYRRTRTRRSGPALIACSTTSKVASIFGYALPQKKLNSFGHGPRKSLMPERSGAALHITLHAPRYWGLIDISGVSAVIQRRCPDCAFEYFAEVKRIIPSNLRADLSNTQIGFQQQSHRFPNAQLNYIFLRRNMKMLSKNTIKMHTGKMSFMQ